MASASRPYSSDQSSGAAAVFDSAGAEVEKSACLDSSLGVDGSSILVPCRASLLVGIPVVGGVGPGRPAKEGDEARSPLLSPSAERTLDRADASSGAAAG
jgi:hypothetical protein